MKNFSLVLNVVLLLAVAYLYYLQFGDAKPKSATPAAVTTEAGAKIPVIAYVNNDSLLSNYNYFVRASEILAQKEQAATTSLEQKGRNLQNQLIAVQQRIQKGELTANQIAQEEQKFAKKQENLAKEQERMTREIMGEAQEIQEELYQKVRAKLKDYCAEKNYDYVFTYADMGSPILLAPDDFDITADILDVLNNADPEEDTE